LCRAPRGALAVAVLLCPLAGAMGSRRGSASFFICGAMKMSTATGWYFLQDGETKGPVQRAEFSSLARLRIVLPMTQVSADKTAWRAASEVFPEAFREATAGTSEQSNPQRSAGPQGWYVRSYDGGEYGPVRWAELSSWASDGSITINCQVREGSDGQWKPAADVFPHLRSTAVSSRTRPAPAGKHSKPDPALKPPKGNNDALYLVLGIAGWIAVVAVAAFLIVSVLPVLRPYAPYLIVGVLVLRVLWAYATNPKSRRL
jgi:hypothetical protein